jgi:hypothetical protein
MSLVIDIFFGFVSLMMFIVTARVVYRSTKLYLGLRRQRREAHKALTLETTSFSIVRRKDTTDARTTEVS